MSSDEVVALSCALARELAALQGLFKKSGAEMAEMAGGHKQPWWSKMVSGQARNPKMGDLEALLAALDVTGGDAERILGLARELKRVRPHTGGTRPRSPHRVRMAGELGNLLRPAVTACPMTFTEIASRAGKSQSWLSKVLAGQSKARPEVEAIAVVAELVSLDEETTKVVLALAAEVCGGTVQEMMESSAQE